MILFKKVLSFVNIVSELFQIKLIYFLLSVNMTIFKLQALRLTKKLQFLSNFLA